MSNCWAVWTRFWRTFFLSLLFSQKIEFKFFGDFWANLITNWILSKSLNLCKTKTFGRVSRVDLRKRFFLILFISWILITSYELGYTSKTFQTERHFVCSWETISIKLYLFYYALRSYIAGCRDYHLVLLCCIFELNFLKPMKNIETEVAVLIVEIWMYSIKKSRCFFCLLQCLSTFSQSRRDLSHKNPRMKHRYR